MRPDSETLGIIIGYCDEIAEDMQRFGTDEEDFLGDKAYQKCIAFTVLQIGEQVKRLSKGLTSTYSDVEWSDIARMRDFSARALYHHRHHTPGRVSRETSYRAD